MGFFLILTQRWGEVCVSRLRAEQGWREGALREEAVPKQQERLLWTGQRKDWRELHAWNCIQSRLSGFHLVSRLRKRLNSGSSSSCQVVRPDLWVQCINQRLVVSWGAQGLFSTPQAQQRGPCFSGVCPPGCWSCSRACTGSSS